MATITLRGNDVHTIGDLPQIGDNAPDFTLVANDMSRKSLNDFKGQRLVINVFPSLDTGTCAASVRRFNQEATSLDNTTVLCISKDLPFAQKRFCGAEGIENVVLLSDFVSSQFGKDYGLLVIDSGMAGLLSRCVLIVDDSGKVTYTQQVAEISEEPNYEEVLTALK